MSALLAGLLLPFSFALALSSGFSGRSEAFAAVRGQRLFRDHSALYCLPLLLAVCEGQSARFALVGQDLPYLLKGLVSS